jgi:cell pole-organizing protein PopZ
MAQNNAPDETSMEDILASIRRIISEEEPAVDASPLELSQPAPPDDDEILVFDEPPTAVEPPPPPVAAPAPIAPVAPPPKAPSWDAEDSLEDQILSEPAVQAAAGAFTRLAGTLRIADTPGQTVEGVVRELLRPMLRDWLDQNLPSIVEAKVEAELERIARLSR